MQKNCCKTCPGCRRHCTADHPHCKFGCKYFARCCESKDKKNHKYKWEKYTAPDGLARQLQFTAHKVKKALRKGRLTEDQLISALTFDERQLFAELLKKLKI